jgi:hypothetical protein
MAKTLNDLVQIILVQQLAFIDEAQDIYKQSRRSKDARNISELMSGLSIFTDSIGTMNDVGVVNIDMESIKVLLNKIELESAYQEETEVQEECETD